MHDGRTDGRAGDGRGRQGTAAAAAVIYLRRKTTDVRTAASAAAAVDFVVPGAERAGLSSADRPYRLRPWRAPKFVYL